jgi:hypothetical protein
MRTIAPSFVVCLALASAPACSTSSANPNGDGGQQAQPTILASNYDQACTRDSDCALIFEAPSGCCSDEIAAINTAAVMKYQADFSAYEATCHRLDPTTYCDDEPFGYVAACKASKCAAVTAPDSGSAD